MFFRDSEFFFSEKKNRFLVEVEIKKGGVYRNFFRKKKEKKRKKNTKKIVLIQINNLFKEKLNQTQKYSNRSMVEVYILLPLQQVMRLSLYRFS